MQDLQSGAEFGPYVVEGLIAGGGMGAVYAARHAVYGSTCALKVLHAKFQPDDEWRKRFHAEGVAGVTLKHPNVLSAREVLVGDDGQIALVLDLVKEGLTLQRVMSREFSTGLPLVQALRVFLGIVQGVEYAHDKQIVHGDIKPENVLIQGDFRDPSTWLPLVTDFGTVGIIAHPVMIDGMAAVVVSPRYASPEHLKGMQHLEPRSDLYCLGLLLHYLVTGQHASAARSVEEAAKRVVQPVLTTAMVDQPAAVVAIFRRAVSFKRRERFQTARELALAVRDLLEQLGEGLDLQDLKADLATEIMEEQHEAARNQRREAKHNAEAVVGNLGLDDLRGSDVVQASEEPVVQEDEDDGDPATAEPVPEGIPQTSDVVPLEAVDLPLDAEEAVDAASEAVAEEEEAPVPDEDAPGEEARGEEAPDEEEAPVATSDEAPSGDADRLSTASVPRPRPRVDTEALTEPFRDDLTADVDDTPVPAPLFEAVVPSAPRGVPIAAIVAVVVVVLIVVAVVAMNLP